jgi:hypothetical protein
MVVNNALGELRVILEEVLERSGDAGLRGGWGKGDWELNPRHDFETYHLLFIGLNDLNKHQAAAHLWLRVR